MGRSEYSGPGPDVQAVLFRFEFVLIVLQKKFFSAEWFIVSSHESYNNPWGIHSIDQFKVPLLVLFYINFRQPDPKVFRKAVLAPVKLNFGDLLKNWVFFYFKKFIKTPKKWSF